MTLTWLLLGLVLFAVVTAVAAFVMATLANRRAIRTDELLAALHVKEASDTSELGGRCSEIRAIARDAAAKAQDAFQATAHMRRGRRLTDPVVPFPPLPKLDKPEPV